jgi:NlpE-like protein
MKKLSIAIVVACLLMSCTSKKNEKATESSIKDTEAKIIEDSNSLEEVSVYEGVLPCADCSGIETVLKIYHGDGTMESHQFELTQVYKGKGEKAFKEYGNFNLERGLEDDPDGTVYVLNWDKPQSEQLFYGHTSTAPDKLYLLNNKREKIKSELNYTLNLKK